MASIVIPATFGRYPTRLYVQLDRALAERHLQQMPAYLSLYTYGNGDLGGKFTIEKKTLLSRRSGHEWVIEMQGIQPGGRNEHIGKGLGRATYASTSPTYAVFYPRTGTLRIHQPVYTDRHLINYRSGPDAGPQLSLGGAW